ncbi:MAG: glycosyltransferase family 4 protein [Spirochaetia bacterium]|nr:glycosyltransferase family 4 protein [Spirochaetia bacterium]
MKIGFDAKRFFFNETGLGNYSRNLIRGLIENYSRHKYYLYSPVIKTENSQKRKKEFENKTTIVEPKTIFNKTFSSFWRSFFIKKDIRINNLDIYHGLSHELPFSIKNTNVKRIVTIHDVIFKKYPSFYGFIDRKVYDLKWKFACKNSDIIIAISESTKKDILKYYSVPEKKIEVVYQSADPIFYKKNTSAVLKSISQKYSLPKKFIIYVGSLNERKNILNALKAIALIKNEKIPLVLVGRGKKYKEILVKEIEKLNIENLVLFFQNVPTEDLPSFYQLASMSIYPSIYEGFGIPVIESLACKTPVILSKVSSLQEAAGPGGCYCDVENPAKIADAILKLNKSGAYRNNLIEKGFRYVQKFTRKNSAKSLMKVYDKCMKL